MRKVFLAFMVLATVVLVGCKDNNEPQLKGRNLVVYGKIFTAENNATAEAFVVEDGKFVYVGNAAGAKAYEKDGFQVINHPEGIIIPGCYEGHAHYLMANGIKLMGGPAPTIKTSVPEFMEMVKASYAQAKAAGKSSIYGFGWMYQEFDYTGMPTRQQLDSICPDIALFVNDSEGHKGLVTPSASKTPVSWIKTARC